VRNDASLDWPEVCRKIATDFWRPGANPSRRSTKLGWICPSGCVDTHRAKRLPPCDDLDQTAISASKSKLSGLGNDRQRLSDRLYRFPRLDIFWDVPTVWIASVCRPDTVHPGLSIRIFHGNRLGMKCSGVAGSIPERPSVNQAGWRSRRTHLRSACP